MKLEKCYINSDEVRDYGQLPVVDVKAQTKGYKPDFGDVKYGCVCFNHKGSHFFYFASGVTKEELEQLGYKGGAK